MAVKRNLNRLRCGIWFDFEYPSVSAIKTKLGKTKWRYSVISSILTNEKYTGNALLGKTFKVDITSARRCKNEGQAPQYYVENTHPAIIDQKTKVK